MLDILARCTVIAVRSAAVALLVLGLLVPAAAQTGEPGVSDGFVQFIAETYLNPKIVTADDVAALYGERITYYGRRQTRDQVVADKLRYYKRWPDRDYALDRDSLKITRKPSGADSSAEVRFEFTYSVSDGRETRRGRGVTRLELIADDGRLVIVSEDGRTLKKL